MTAELLAVKQGDGTLLNFVLNIGGDRFFCGCGCNVFHHPDCTRLDVYECNGCGEWFRGED